MLTALNSDLARPLEPSYDEMNPPPEPEKEYRFSLGDTVYLGTHEYELLSFDENEVVLYDTQFPLFNKTMTREEFEDRLKENPLNDHLLQVVEQTLTPDNTETRIALDTDREKVYWIYFNPDSTAGGQYVSGELDFNVFKELIDQYDIGNHPENAEQFTADLEEMSDQFLADINTPFFAEAENEYEGTTEYTGFTSQNILQIHEAILSYETDRDAERDLNRHEAEFGADGTRVFSDDEERQGQPETGPFIDHYYVVEDLAAAPLSVTEYPDREEALEAYFALPADTMKAFGVVNTKELPGSLDFIQCRDGKDTLIEDYAKTDDDAWRNHEIEGLVDQLKEKLSERDKPIAPPPQKQRNGKVTPHVLLPEINTEYRTNFRIERDDIGVGTPLERFHHNRMAIQLLKKLEDEHRLADTNEQRILADYVGWGGLSDYFKEDNPHYQELKELLTEEEYASARESTLTAFYTPPVVIKAVYSALENMHFRTGNVLEPSCGIGNFMGLVPDSMASAKFYGVELDSISGRIAQQLYQNSSIAVQGFEDTNLPDSFFDAAVGNVPFGQFKVPDKRYDKHNFLIHDYFFARTLDKVRPGGVVAFITSKGTMDKENPAVRKYIAQRADLLGAIRLPNNTFKDAAGTEVTSDIIFLQKRDRLIDIEPEWVHLATDENGIRMNSYFVSNPEMVLGDMQMISGAHGPESACIPYEDAELGDLLQDAIQNIHAEITEFELDDLEAEDEDLSIPADPSVRNFSYTVVDGILICDPEGEYAPLVEAMGNLGSVIRVSAGGRDRLNAMYMVDGYGENNPIVVKSEFIMSLIEQIDKKGVGPQHKSIIDRCITNVYRNAAEDGTVPTLCTLRDMLLEQPEPEAKQIALSLELYTTGSLDIFGKQSNVDLDKRIVVFDIHGLGSQLKPTGLLVITDTMLNRVTLNWKKGKRTHVFIDEFHVVFENEFSAQFFNSAWRQFRKRNAYPTAITQNVEYLLDSVQASTMLSNSEFVIMLNQAASDREKLARLLNISNEQMSYITNADAGCGLIKYGSALVPFINQFPHDTKLYQLMTTRPGEGEFARGQD